MKLNKKLLTTLLILILFFIMTNQLSSHTINNRPGGNWSYSGYRPELRANFVVPYVKLSTLDNFNSNYRSITNTASSRWNNGVNEVFLSKGVNTDNNVGAYSGMWDNRYAYYKRWKTNGQHVTISEVRYNDYLMKNFSRTDQDAVAIHEFGHVLGLDHFNNPYQIMRPDPTTRWIKTPSVDELNAVDWINSY